MKEPTTREGVFAFHALRQSDPRKALKVASQWIVDNPDSSTAYFSRHDVWLELGEPARALEDLNKSAELQPEAVTFRSRGNVYRRLGDYERALADYKRGEAIDPGKWRENAIPLLYQADVHAKLGDEVNALDCCARLPDHFWTPGHNDLPPGGKAEIAVELRRRAAAAIAAAPTAPRTPPARS